MTAAHPPAPPLTPAEQATLKRFRLVQRRGSEVAHAARTLDNGNRSDGTLCGQWAPGHSSWPVQPEVLPLCARCRRYLGAAS